MSDPAEPTSRQLLVRWTSAVVVIAAGFLLGALTENGWWVLGSAALSAALDRFVWRRVGA